MQTHDVSSQTATLFSPLPTTNPQFHSTTTETFGPPQDESLLSTDLEATYQTGTNVFIDLTLLQSLARNIFPCQEMCAFPSLAEVSMLLEARHAVNLLPSLSHHNRHHVKTWHLYCDGSYYKASSKYDETCAMAIVGRRSLPLWRVYLLLG